MLNFCSTLRFGAVLLFCLLSVGYGLACAQEAETTEAAKRDGLIPTKVVIEQLTKRVEKYPQDYASLTLLGQVYVRQARENDDVSSYRLAEAAFRDAINVTEKATSAQVYLIDTLQAQHQFQAAYDQSDLALTAIPGNLLALLGKGDAALELGNVDEAGEIFSAIAQQKKLPAVIARVARIYELHGETDRAIASLEQARQLAIAVDALGKSAAWYSFRLGTIHAAIGDYDSAIIEYEEGLKQNPDSATILAGLAEATVAKGRVDDAVTFYERSLELDRNPVTLGQLASTMLRLGDRKRSKVLIDEAADLFAAQQETSGDVHVRERALFLLQHNRDLPLALELTTRDLELRQDVFSHSAHAWALIRNNQLALSAEHAAQATTLPVPDALLWYRAGVIADQAGEVKIAIDRLQKCLKINSRFDRVLVADANERLSVLTKTN